MDLPARHRAGRTRLQEPLFFQDFDHAQDQRDGVVLHLRTQVYEIHPIVVELAEALYVIDLLMKHPHTNHGVAVEPILEVNLDVEVELSWSGRDFSGHDIFLELLIEYKGR